MASTNCLVPRGLASVIFCLHQKVIHSPIVVMVEKLGLYSQALALYQKTSLCKALVLRYSKPLCLDLSELIFSGYAYPLCSPYSLMFTSVLGLSALRSLVCISLMQEVNTRFPNVVPLLYQGLVSLSTISPKIADSDFERASSSRLCSRLTGVIFSFFAWDFIRSQ